MSTVNGEEYEAKYGSDHERAAEETARLTTLCEGVMSAP
jgi:hypothetical protein